MIFLQKESPKLRKLMTFGIDLNINRPANVLAQARLKQSDLTNIHNKLALDLTAFSETITAHIALLQSYAPRYERTALFLPGASWPISSQMPKGAPHSDAMTMPLCAFIALWK